MAPSRLTPLTQSDLSSESRLGDFLIRCIENVERGNQSDPNDPMYMVGTIQPQTCIDYFFDKINSGENKTHGRVEINAYYGKMEWLRDRLNINPRYTALVSDALMDLYFRNNYINPSSDQCHFVYDAPEDVYMGGGTRATNVNINCMQKMITYMFDQGSVPPNEALSMLSTVPDFIQSGTCNRLVTETGRISNDRNNHISCLDSLLDVSGRIEDKARFARFLSSPKFDLTSARCYNYQTESACSCFERIIGDAVTAPDNTPKPSDPNSMRAAVRDLVAGWLLKPSTSREFFHYMSRRIPYSRNRYNINGYQYLLETSTGSNQISDTILSHKESGFKDATCYNEHGSESCTDTVIRQACEALERTPSPDSSRAKMFIDQALRNPSIYLDAFKRAKYISHQTYGDIEVSLANYVLTYMYKEGQISQNDVIALSKEILLGKSNDEMVCAGNWGPTSCTDALVSSGLARNLSLVRDIKIDLSQPICRDKAGRQISCIDKLLQREEVYQYYHFRMQQLSRKTDDLIKRTSKSTLESTKEKLSVLRKLAEREKELLTEFKARYTLYSGMEIDATIYSTNQKYDLVKTMCKPPVSYGPNQNLDVPDTDEIVAIRNDYEESIIQVSEAKTDSKRRLAEIKNEYLRQKLTWTTELNRGALSGSEITQACALGMLTCNEQMYMLLQRLEKSKSESTKSAVKHEMQSISNEIDLIYKMHASIASKQPQTVSCMQRSMEVIENNIPSNRRGEYVDNMMSHFNNRVVAGDMDLIQSRCRETDGTKVACISRYVDFLHNISPIDTDAASGLFRLKESVQSVCRDASGKNVPCISYAIGKIGPAMVSSKYAVDILLNPDFKKVMKLQIETDSGTKTSLGDVVCKNITVPDLAKAIENRRGSIDTEQDVASNYSGSGKALEMLASCRCTNTSSEAERKMCLDYFCLEKSNRVSQHTPWSKEYLQNLPTAYQKQGFDGSDDPLDITGVYDVRYNQMRDPSALMLYSDKAMMSIALLKGAEQSDLISEVTMIEPGYLYYREFAGKYTLVGNDSTGKPSKSDIIRVPDLAESDYMLKVTTSDGEVYTDSVASFIDNGDIPSNVRLQFEPYRSVLDEVKSSKPRVGETRLSLVIGNRPMDYMRTSTCQKWSSCYNMLGGENRNTLLTYMRSGAYVAYLVSNEFSPTWLARSWILPLAHDKHYPIPPPDGHYCVSVQRPYGETSYKTLITDAVMKILSDSGHNGSTCPSTLDNIESMRFKRYPTHYLPKMAASEYLRTCVSEADASLSDGILNQGKYKERVSQCESMSNSIASSTSATAITGSPSAKKYLSADMIKRLTETGIFRYWFDALHYADVRDPPSGQDFFAIHPKLTEPMLNGIRSRELPDFVSIQRRKPLSEYPEEVAVDKWV